jgi:predicted nucleic acid-binding protein
MKTLFADTFFFFAFLNASDSAHAPAEAYFEDFDGRLVTTEWVLTELADGMAAPGDRLTFVEFHKALRSDPAVTIVASDPALFAAGVELYAARDDKDWTLTDCISFVVMKRESLTEALTGDKHFEQAGFNALLK